MLAPASAGAPPSTPAEVHDVTSDLSAPHAQGLSAEAQEAARVRQAETNARLLASVGVEGARKDVLSAYLACPQNKARFNYVLEQMWHKVHGGPFSYARLGKVDMSTRDVAPPEHAELDSLDDPDVAQALAEGNQFRNAYSPDIWWMESNFRLTKDVPYFASDVTLAQFHMASRCHGFGGRLPKSIVRAEITNPTTLAFFEDAGPTPDLQRFLTETPNGKHTRRILDALRMEATRLEWDARTKDATVHVRPLA